MILLWAMWISFTLFAVWFLLWVSYNIFEIVEEKFYSRFLGVSAGSAVFLLLSPFGIFFVIIFGHSLSIIG